MFPQYDIIVVGAGHAGCEAAAAAGQMGSKVLLITMNMNTIAQMSCNPAMEVLPKGKLSGKLMPWAVNQVLYQIIPVIISCQKSTFDLSSNTRRHF